MTKEEYRAAIDNVIWLCGCAVNKTHPDSERIANINLGHLYKAAKKHMLTATVAYALRSAGILDKSFEQARSKSVGKLLLWILTRHVYLREWKRDRSGICHSKVQS